MSRLAAPAVTSLVCLALAGPLAAQIEVIPESELDAGGKFAVAIERGDLDRVRALLDSGLAVDTGIEYGEGFESPLMKAAWDGEAAIVDLLIARGANVNFRSADGGAALFQAVSREHEGIVAALLAAKADPNLVNAYQQTPLTGAVGLKNQAIVGRLLDAGAKHELPGAVLTPLMFAVFGGDEAMIRLLVRRGAKVNFAAPDSGQSALTSAIVAGKPEIVKLLIELEANVNQKAPDGETPLKLARNGDQDDVAAMLVAAGAKE